MKLSLLDLSALAVDGPARPATFAVIQHFGGPRTIESLVDGARRAMAVFPRSSCSVAGARLQAHPAVPVISECEEDDESRIQARIEQFLSAAMDPEEFPLIRQLLVHSREKSLLVSRFHHVLCDGLAALQWLSVQLRGDESGITSSSPRVRQSRTPRRSLPRWVQTAAWPVRAKARGSLNGPMTGPIKKFHTLWLDEEAIRLRLRESRAGATLNDWLCARLFEAMRDCSGEALPDLSLWIPLSVRRDPFSYFGNASSRIRLREPRRETDGAKALHLAMEQALESGSWDFGRAALPAGAFVSSIPSRVLVAGLRAYFSRPGMDPCTSAFSFLSRASRLPDEEAFPGVERIETVGQLHRAHAFAFSAAVFRGNVALTCFWDPVRMDEAEMGALLRAVERRTAQPSQDPAQGQK